MLLVDDGYDDATFPISAIHFHLLGGRILDKPAPAQFISPVLVVMGVHVPGTL